MDRRLTDVLAQLEPQVNRLFDEHVRGTESVLPTPDELLFSSALAEERPARLELLRREAAELPPHCLVLIVLNLLTEEGLPHFHRLLAVYLGNDSFWNRWIDRWTAEEDRHGAVLGSYVRYTGIVSIRALERLQFAYLAKGFRPRWQSFYELVAYTVVQELATQLSHAGVARLARDAAPSLTKIFGRIAGEEGRHAHFYREVFRIILLLDPDHALQALKRVLLSFAMPGEAIPGYQALAYVAKRLIFGGFQFRSIVEDLISDFDLGSIKSVTRAGAEAKNAILKFPALLERMTKAFEAKPKEKLLFDFLPDLSVTV